MYAVMLVRMRYDLGGKEFTCITQKSPGEDLAALKKIEQDYFIVAFVDLEGKTLDEAWIDDLAS